MNSRQKMHFEVSERMVLLRLFDIIFVLGTLHLFGIFFEFSYFNLSFHTLAYSFMLVVYLMLMGTVFEMYNLQIASSQYQIIKSILLTTSSTVLFYFLTPVFTPSLPMNRIQIVYFFLGIFIGLLVWRLLYQRLLASHRFEKRAVLLCNADECNQLVLALEEIIADVEKGNFEIEDSFEDVHSKIEYLLTVKLGDAGKKIHTARSRNDQVLVDVNLYLKDVVKELKEQVKTLFDLLMESADKHQNVLLPGYTHLQIAMPSSFGMWFSAYADDVECRFENCGSKSIRSCCRLRRLLPYQQNIYNPRLRFRHLEIQFGCRSNESWKV